VLSAVSGLLQERGEVVALVKPQFEAGREHVGKGGIVKDSGVQLAILERLVAKSEELGFTVRGVTYSPIKGADGNIEFFLWLARSGAVTPLPHNILADLVRQAQSALEEKSRPEAQEVSHETGSDHR
jgi:23S rRNA (cytidine1920-2'-O)/16S rRNA (cytidine1409-2'-O)-methyltransferase